MKMQGSENQPQSAAAGNVPPAARGRGLWLVGRIAGEAIDGFVEDAVPRMGAAIAYYMTFSLAPLLVALLALASVVLQGDEARGYLFGMIGDALGPGAVVSIEEMVHSLQERQRTASVLAVGTMLVGATAVLMEMKSALDTIFGAPGREERLPLVAVVLARLKTFLLLLVLGALMLGSFVLSSVLTSLAARTMEALPDWWELARVLEQSVAFCSALLLNLVVFKLFPAHPPSRTAALIGALVTTVLFLVGRLAIATYIGVAGTASAFGAAGTLAVLLVWVHFSAQILLFGAQVCRACDRLWLYPDGVPRRGGRGTPQG